MKAQMKKIPILILCTAAALLVVGSFVSHATTAQGAEMDGKEIFLGNKCNTCHGVAAAGIEAKMKAVGGGDLGGLADQYDAEWIAQYVKREVQKDDKDHKKEWKGSDEELAALVAWLLEQPAAP